mmetsp:Transcript_26317/g.59588  ORF Transcript_26317/g.59588 Transcript_26317/m.59588 type:complete len:248 (-) Transcript_26317:707-1450(-)
MYSCKSSKLGTLRSSSPRCSPSTRACTSSSASSWVWQWKTEELKSWNRVKTEGPNTGCSTRSTNSCSGRLGHRATLTKVDTSSFRMVTSSSSNDTRPPELPGIARPGKSRESVQTGPGHGTVTCTLAENTPANGEEAGKDRHGNSATSPSKTPVAVTMAFSPSPSAWDISVGSSTPVPSTWIRAPDTVIRSIAPHTAAGSAIRTTASTSKSSSRPFPCTSTRRRAARDPGVALEVSSARIKAGRAFT